MKEERIRGKLCIFLGYAAGVGKTYAMLEEAQQLKMEGVDVVAGYIEPHARPDTSKKAEGLEVIPPIMVEYKGIQLREMNLDAILARHPAIVLVDEMAHTNAEGLRHRKRYEDIEEILKAGIDVYTTVNIQHLESLNDIVSRITGIHVRERLPDQVFDEATQVKLIDIEPEILIQRLKEGKIYKVAQAQRALSNFFAREKLIALREIALRRMADKVNGSALEEQQSRPWEGKSICYQGEHILTCISPSPTCQKVIRSAYRLAAAFHGQFTALYVETPSLQNMDDGIKRMRDENIQLAKDLGAKIVTVFGEDVAFQIAEYARISGVSKVVLGRTNHRMLFGQMRGTLTDRISEYIPDIDIYIIPDTSRGIVTQKKKRWKKHMTSNLTGSERPDAQTKKNDVQRTVVRAGVILAIMTAIAYVLRHFHYGFSVVVLAIASLALSQVITGIRRQIRQSAKVAYRTQLLLENSRRMRRIHDVEDLLKELSGQVLKLMQLSVIFYVKKGEQMAGPWLFPNNEIEKEELKKSIDEKERTVAEWVMVNRQRAGCCTHTLQAAKAMYLPIKAGEDIYAVMGIVLSERREIPAFEYGVLTAMLNEAALVFARMEKEQR